MAKVLALVDGSIYSESVCDHAVWAAKALDADIQVTHVLGPRQGSNAAISNSAGFGRRAALSNEIAVLDANRAKLGELHGQALLEDAAAHVSQAHARVVTALREGDLVTELGDLSETADLVVLGKRGEAADFAKGHLGSNLERVVRSCLKPILVASRAYSPIKRIVIAFDGGASSLKAVDHIACSPVFRDVEVHLLTVGADQIEAHRKLDAAALKLSAADFDVDIELIQGVPADEINARVQQGAADMLVMGAYGHSRIRNLIIGSTTTEMIRRCGVSLMLFRETPLPLSDKSA